MCYRGTSFALAYSPGILKMRGLWRRTRDLIGSAPGAGGQAAIAPGDPTVEYRLKAIPPSEMETTIRLIRSHPEYFNGRIAETYAALGLKVIDDSFGREVSDHAAEALKSAVPSPWCGLEIGSGLFFPSAHMIRPTLIVTSSRTQSRTTLNRSAWTKRA